MNYEWFKEWKNDVGELNKISDDVDKGRDKAYQVMSDEIKKIFSKNGTPVDAIHFSSDSSVIIVKLIGNTSNAISFKKSFLINIGMPFSVQRRLSKEGHNEMYLELYPFEEE